MAAKAEKEITADDVIACYKYIFGRQPESREVIDLHYNACNTVGELREAFFQSMEFQLSHHAAVPATDDYGIKAYQMQSGGGADRCFILGLFWQGRRWDYAGSESKSGIWRNGGAS